MNGMTVIVKTITKLIVGAIFIYAANTIIYGHLSPGGGFAGGVMVACGLILVVLAFGKHTAFTIIPEGALDVLASSAVDSVVELALLGFLGSVFLHWFPLGRPFAILSGGSVMTSNIIVGIKVALFLYAVIMALFLFRMNKEQ